MFDDSAHAPLRRCPLPQRGARVRARIFARQQEARQQGTAAPPQSAEPYASTYKPPASRTTVIRNATVLTAAGPVIERGAVLLRDGKVVQAGATVDAPADAMVIDATGKWVTPGIIDTHSHLGVYPAPAIEAVTRRQRGDEPEYRRSVGRTFGVAAGPAVRARAGGRRHHHAPAARIGEPVWRPRRYRQERCLADGRRDEVSWCALWPEDGVRGEPEARLRQPQHRTRHAHGQCRRLSEGLAVRHGVPRALAPLARRWRRSHEAAGSQPPARNARGRARRRNPRPEPLLSRRRNGDHDRPRQGVRLSHQLVPSRRRGLQGRRPAGRQWNLREHVGRLVGLQARSLRRYQAQHPAGRTPPVAARSCTPTMPLGCSG